MSKENVDLVRRAYERLAEQDALGDWSWFFEEFADEELGLHGRRPTTTCASASRDAARERMPTRTSV
jgi:hypothetical protein